MKLCSLCKQPKDLAEFRKSKLGKGGLQARCKACIQIGQQTQLAKVYADPVKHERLKAHCRARDARRRDSKKRKDWWKNYEQTPTGKASRHVQNMRRRVRKINAVGDYTREEYESLGKQCLCCGRSDTPMTVDHVIPLSKGGTNFIHNIQPLCEHCNKSKGARAVDYRWPTPGYYGA